MFTGLTYQTSGNILCDRRIRAAQFLECFKKDRSNRLEYLNDKQHMKRAELFYVRHQPGDNDCMWDSKQTAWPCVKNNRQRGMAVCQPYQTNQNGRMSTHIRQTGNSVCETYQTNRNVRMLTILDKQECPYVKHIRKTGTLAVCRIY